MIGKQKTGFPIFLRGTSDSSVFVFLPVFRIKDNEGSHNCKYEKDRINKVDMDNQN